MDLTTVVFGVIGLCWGLVSDRIAARWPEHEGGSVRPVDWRTATVAVIGAVALAALAGKFDGQDLGLFGVYFLALDFLLATDLDQRLLPDLVTLPAIPFALAWAVTGTDPLVGRDIGGAMAVGIGLPVVFFGLSVPFGAGAIGIGDLKLLVSVGLLAGFTRTIIGVVSGAFVAGIVVLALLVTRRVGLRSYIPFGPFLIVGAMWAILGPS